MTQTKAELLQTRHQGDIRLGDADSSHYVGFKAPTTVGTSLVWTLPAADGTANYLLKTDGSGNLGWVADSSTDSTKMPLAGGTFTGDVTFNDNVKARFGTGADLEIYHSGSISMIDNAEGNLHIRNKATSGQIKIQPKSGEEGINVIQDGAVELYHNNVKKFETTSTGANLYGHLLPDTNDTHDLGSSAKRWSELHLKDYLYMPDDGKIRLGAAYDFQFFHNGSHSAILGKTGHTYVSAPTGQSVRLTKSVADNFNAETMLAATADGAVELYYDDSKKLETKNYGVDVIGDLYLTDNNKLQIGTSTDLELWHDGSNSYITNKTGVINIQAKQTENSIVLNPDGGVDLYHNNVKKIETTAQAVKITGGIAQVVTAAAALELDLNTSNYFTKTISGNSTFTFANPAASGTVTAFTLELTHSSGTVTWPSSVKWNADTAPTLTTGKTHLFMFVTDDGGTRYRGSALVDYVN